MQDWLINPVMQGAVLPFIAGLLASALLAPVRLAGLAPAVGFAIAVYLVVGFQFSPMTTLRKLVLAGLAAPVLAVAADLAFTPRRTMAPLLALACGAISVWVFFALLAQKDFIQGLLSGGGIGAYVAWQVGFALALREDPVRAGAASLALGIGTGAAAVLAASATLGLYGLALGSASGAFLLVQMVTGKRAFAGLALTLTAGLVAGLLGGAAYHLAELPWYALALLTLVPLAARAPIPAKWPIWGQAAALSAAALVPAGLACYVIWRSSRGMPA